ncbi:MAG TPA: hypothetical protein VFU69_11805 [Ktedonobacterales bacterium]|nr:hypothetical protein [Ktedonobacterales bacterium]
MPVAPATVLARRCAARVGGATSRDAPPGNLTALASLYALSIIHKPSG